LHSGPVLLALTICLPFSPLGATRGHILYATYHHKVAAWVAIGEAVSNLALSVVLVRRLGIVGVAWGTVIPSLINGLAIMPVYTCRLLGVGFLHYCREVLLRPLAVSVPSALFMWFASRAGWFNNWVGLFLNTIIAVLLFAIVAWKWSVEPEEREALLQSLLGLGSKLYLVRRKVHEATSSISQA
jgi:O-antigen/teichoic acid export membrane protein